MAQKELEVAHSQVLQQSQLAEVEQQRILDSRSFSQSEERRNRITKAHRDTYRWILRPKAQKTSRRMVSFNGPAQPTTLEEFIVSTGNRVSGEQESRR